MLLALAVPALGASTAYAPHVDPADFVAGVDHPFLPLVPGTVFRFNETVGKHVREIVVTVTSDTKIVMGVKCVVVRDQEFEKGKLIEDTYDWYAQDKQGNVWYFGEDTKEMRNGKVDPEGSWEAGVRGAQPGLALPAQLAPGQPYRQEYLKGVAEDMAQIVAVADSVTVPFGALGGCVRVREWSPLEHGSEMKWYAKGVGVVRSESTEHEIAELMSVTRP